MLAFAARLGGSGSAAGDRITFEIDRDEPGLYHTKTMITPDFSKCVYDIRFSRLQAAG